MRGGSNPGGTSSQKFVGKLGHPSEDNTGLIYMRARYYDPVNGRFASEDPAKVGRSWFTYCADNPVNYHDQTGREMSASDIIKALEEIMNTCDANWSLPWVTALKLKMAKDAWKVAIDYIYVLISELGRKGYH